MAIGDSTMLNPFLTQSFDPNRPLPPNYQEARNAFQQQQEAQRANDPFGPGQMKATVIGNDQFGQQFGYAADADAFNQFYNQNYGNKMTHDLPSNFISSPIGVGIVSPGGPGGVGTTTYFDNLGNRIDGSGNIMPPAQPPSFNNPFGGIPPSGGLRGLTDNYSNSPNYSNPIGFLPSEPITPGEPAAGASQIDATIRPFLTEGLRQAQEIFLRQQPQMFPGQTYVSPSEQTLQSIQAQEDIARQQSPVLQQAQQAYQSSLGQVGQTAAGGFLNANPYQQAMMEAATRPLTQQFSQAVLPGISSLYSKSGRLGSGAMERALGTATESYGRSLGDITSNIAGSQYQQERGLQQAAQLQQAALAQAAPQIYGQQFLPSQTLGQVGAQREAISAQPLQEQMGRFAYQQRLPYEQLSGYLSSVYGSPLGQFGTPAAQPTYQNRTAGALGGGIAGGLGGYALGSMLPSSFLGGYGGIAGGALGALGGGLLGGGYF
jgi:hypothetical protein